MIVSAIERCNRDMSTTFTMERKGSRGRLTVTGLEDPFGSYGSYNRQPESILKTLNDAFKDVFEYLVGDSNESVILTLDIAMQTSHFLKETN